MESRRKAELEAKRAKLNELRKAREERRATLAATTPISSTESPEPRPSSRAQLDELVASLLGPNRRDEDAGASSPALSTPALAISGRSSRLSLGSNAPSEPEAPGSERGSSALNNELADACVRGTSPRFTYADRAPSPTSLNRCSRSRPRCWEHGLDSNSAPQPRLTYDKGIQTAFSLPTASDRQPDESTGGVGSSVISEAELRARLRREIEAEKAELDRQIAEEKRRAEEEEAAVRLRGLPPDALASIYSSSEFGAFLQSSTKIVQRALSDGYDYLRDYSIGGGDAALDEDGQRKRVKLVCSFSDERWTHLRSVTSVDWSPKYPELSLAAYNRNPMAVADPDGVVCIWNLHMTDRPEYLFHAPSDVLACAFSPFHPNLVAGGTYSGQVLLWDTRAKHLPVLKSPLSASGHTHPVYSIQVVGTPNAHHLLSASTDGTVCAWALDMLARPQESLELVHPAHAKTEEVAVTSVAFAHNETATFWVGTEEGTIFTANRYDRAGAKAGLVQNELYRGHSGPVLGLDFHPLVGPIDFSDLFLSCGVDWTVRLWRARGGSGSGAKPATTGGPTPATAATIVSPIATFEEADDYVFDVKWHPTHPAVFGTVDGAGKFDIYNLNVDSEVPTVSTLVDAEAPRGLNKLAWDREGKKAALGSSDGRLHIYDIGTLGLPAENESETTRKTLSNMLARI